ncbi:hypothetical protein PoB_000450400, partial [Plakobranchus ocellatus]
MLYRYHRGDERENWSGRNNQCPQYGDLNTSLASVLKSCFSMLSAQIVHKAETGLDSRSVDSTASSPLRTQKPFSHKMISR